jgi:chemotaxis receptor (MCP) glutamine deamidase CheD
MNIRDGLTREILPKRVNQTNAWEVSTKYSALELHALIGEIFLLNSSRKTIVFHLNGDR